MWTRPGANTREADLIIGYSFNPNQSTQQMVPKQTLKSARYRMLVQRTEMGKIKCSLTVSEILWLMNCVGMYVNIMLSKLDEYI